MQYSEILSLASLRLDGRKYNELRKIKYKINLESSSLFYDGSCYFEQGLNKILVYIKGPIEIQNKMNDSNIEKGIVQCSISNAPFSGTDRKPKKTVDRRLQEMENIIVETFESVIMTELYPKSEISIIVHILESDGSIICTIVNAITMALLEAGISMTDMIVSCSVGRVNNQLYLDVTQLEQNSGIYLPVVMKSRNKEIIYMQLDNRITLDALQLALNEVQIGCNEVIELIESAIKEFMSDTLRIQNTII